jgi:hypothetical protein
MSSLIEVYKLDVKQYDEPVVVSKDLSSLDLLKAGEEYQLSAWIGSLRGYPVTYENVKELEDYRPSVLGTERCDKSMTPELQKSLLEASLELLESDKNILAVTLRIRKKWGTWWRVAIWTSSKDTLYSYFWYSDPATGRTMKLELLKLSK